MSILKLRHLNKNALRRFYSKQTKSAKIVRRDFLDYFMQHADHKFIKSSPVVPYNDLNTPFVNAGMNQFKGILLGLNNPPARRVVNSQKCIRVGGKHNDLDVVGTDTYHHTFFEMLGNWSFEDYFKKEACEYAWKLLTGPYGINKDHLYVTYFKGDEKMGIEPDLECKNIWRELGVPEDRILPFGMTDNFWEMGVTGPCGPCTEIHIDLAKLNTNQAVRINKGHSDLTELWNIVFIQYQRLNDGTIIPLEKHHVDTGMGFERLLAVVQNKRSNYSTDLFQPLFKAIEHFAKVPQYEDRYGLADKNGRDTSYRILADHARMLTVAISDGISTDQNANLKRVIRNAISISENVFRKNGMLKELSYRVVESLGETYPELEKNINKVHNIINYEEETLKTIRSVTDSSWKKLTKTRPELSVISEVTPGLIPAYNELQNLLNSDSEVSKFKTISGEFAFKLYDTYGLNSETISELAKVESLEFDVESFKQQFEKKRQETRWQNVNFNNSIINDKILNTLEKISVPKTDDSFKYNYNFDSNGYHFPSMQCTLLDIVVDGTLLSQGDEMFDESQMTVEATVTQSGNIVETEAVINPSTEVALLLDQTPFYASEGGQIGDKGIIEINNLMFNVNEVRKIQDYVFHIGNFVITDNENFDFEVEIGVECKATIDRKLRLGAMRHHSAIHLLNAAVKQIFPASGQRSSSATKDKLSYEFNAFGSKPTLADIVKIEDLINDCIVTDAPVKTKVVDLLEMLADESITKIPGEIYPDDKIRVVEINSNILKSKEACCGTHVLSTSALEYFSVLNLKSQGGLSCSITAAVGTLARLSKLAGENLSNNVSNVIQEFANGNLNKNNFNQSIKEIREQLNNKNNKTPIPYVVKKDCLVRIENFVKEIKQKEIQAVSYSIENEMKNVLKSSKLPFVVHYLQLNDGSLDLYPLPKITKLCHNVPVLLIAYSKGLLKARCCVPKEMITEEFNAKSWMANIQRILDIQILKPTNEKSIEVCEIKVKKFASNEIKILIDKCISEATQFASTHMKNLSSRTKK